MRSAKRKGTFVVIDGIDGSGKGTLVRALGDWAKQKKMKVLDVVRYEQRYHTLPLPEEIERYDALLTAEPTHSLVGRSIREEIIRDNERHYTASITAVAYSLDRYVLLQRVILPALAAGKFVFQERSVSTSLVYQPIQAERLTVQQIMRLEGNQLALRHRPDLLCILSVDVDATLRRLNIRKKKDAAVFEKKKFLVRAQRRFLAPWFRKVYTNRGAQVEVISTDCSMAESRQRMLETWEAFLRKQ